MFILISRTCAQVDPVEPEHLKVFQRDTTGMVAEVAPRWVHSQSDVMANICWLEHLHKSNRVRLYEGICKAVSQGMVGRPTPPKSETKIPFEVVQIAGDGRCGFRCLICLWQGFLKRQNAKSCMYT